MATAHSRACQAVATVLISVLAATACAGDNPVAPPTPASITLSSSTLSFTLLGAATQLAATVRDQDGQLMAGVGVIWSSSDAAIVSVSSSGLATAVGNGAATITAVAGAARSTAGVSVNDPDIDGDEIINALDSCPADPETFNSWLDEDGCPDDTSELYLFSRADIEIYWQLVFTASNLSYEPILAFSGYDEPFQSVCGSIPIYNAVYCPLNYGVYYHRAFMDGYLANVGDMAPAFIVSHEIGHHITFLLRYFNPSWRAAFPELASYPISNKQSELMADCFGGAWVVDADRRGLIEEGDGEEAVNTLIFDRRHGHSLVQFRRPRHGRATTSCLLGGNRSRPSWMHVTRLLRHLPGG